MGGLTREWYEVMAGAICDPNRALFQSEPPRAQTYQPSKNAVIQNESMVNFRDYFRFCGRFVGKALIDGQQLSCYFTRSFYKHMLAIPLTLKVRCAGLAHTCAVYAHRLPGDASLLCLLSSALDPGGCSMPQQSAQRHPHAAASVCSKCTVAAQNIRPLEHVCWVRKGYFLES